MIKIHVHPCTIMIRPISNLITIRCALVACLLLLPSPWFADLGSMALVLGQLLGELL